MDKYRNFNELQKHEKEGVDYEIQTRDGRSGIAVVAPHGGGIEPGTVDIADSVAGCEHSFYCFKGIKKSGNADLHITSDKFDEPNGIKIAKEADLVLSIHGCRGPGEFISIGGNDPIFRKRLSDALSLAGFIVMDHPRWGLEGGRPNNICNRGRTGRGGQIELSEGLRKKMFDHLDATAGRQKRETFFELVAALRKALDHYSFGLI